MKVVDISPPSMKSTIGFIVLAFSGILVLVLVFGSFVIIGPGERGIVLQLGAVQDRIMQEGLNFKIPLIQSVEKVDIKTQKEEVTATAASRDLQTVTAQIALNYHIHPDKVNKLWQTIGADYKSRVIDPAIHEAVKASTARFNAEELITKRSEVKEDITNLLRERLIKEFIEVVEFSIVNFDFSPSFNAAVESKVTAEQNALAAKNKLEQVKYEATQRIEQARGEAEAIKIQTEAIRAQGGKEYVGLKAIEKWNGTMPQYYTGSGNIAPLSLFGINLKNE